MERVSVPDYLKKMREETLTRQAPQCKVQQPQDDMLYFCCHGHGEFEGNGGICPICGKPACD